MKVYTFIVVALLSPTLIIAQGIQYHYLIIIYNHVINQVIKQFH